ncbi:MAG: protein kinase [Pyrinomonadaceae bacterium]
MLDKLIGLTLAGKYRIDEMWRPSGLGKVYHGTHLLMDKPVALKVLSPALAVDVNIVNRFSAEARTVSGLSHPNILSVTDFGSDDEGTVFIVMEDATGELLKDRIEREEKFSVEAAVHTARQIASALSAAHSKGVVHRRLTAENILLAKTGNGGELVKVLDFGAAHPEDDGLFAEETAAGDWEYAAPEQNSSSSEPDERSDIYSLGVILYEMLTGRLPYAAADREELVTKQSENPPPPFSAFRDDLPDELEQLVLRAMANNPDMRYQKAEALAEDLAQIAKEFGGADGLVVSAAAGAAAGDAKNNLWKTAFVVLAGISLLSVGMIYATYTRQTEPTTALQPDAQALPVQPLNPATGINEQNLVFSPDTTVPDLTGNPNGQMPEVIPGGDGYDPWARGGAPPPGAPTYAPGGQIITVPEGGSQFMPNFTPEGGYVLVPVPANTNTNPNPAASPKGEKPPANTQPTPAPKESPTGTPPAVKPTPAPAKPETTPAVKPTEKPKPNPPASSETKVQSGKERDTN